MEILDGCKDLREFSLGNVRNKAHLKIKRKLLGLGRVEPFEDPFSFGCFFLCNLKM